MQRDDRPNHEHLPDEGHPARGHSVEHRSAEHRSTEHRSTEHRSTEHRSSEHRPAERRLVELRSVGGRHAEEAPLPEAHPDPKSACSMTTGDLARACETTVRTVRFYEEAGVLCPETRSDGGHRLFGNEELQKLQLIMDLREAGLSLNDIKALFELKHTAKSPEEASAQLSQALGAQIDEMQRKIATLRRLRDELASTVAIIQECQSCEKKDFPKQCARCDVMNRGDLPRAMRLLWGY